MRRAVLHSEPMKRWLVVLSLGAASAASAADIPCSPVEKGDVHLDGMLDDWSGVAGLEMGGRNADLSFTAKCRYDGSKLYLSVDVRDSYLVRTKQVRPGEDHVEIALGDGVRSERLVVYPADGSAPRKLRWASGRTLRGVEIADSLQPAGWSVEAAIPLVNVPGWEPGVPEFRLAVGVVDCDAKSRPVERARLTTAPLDSPKDLGRVELEEARAALEGFLRDRGLTPADIVFDQVGRIRLGGKARVLLVGKYLVAITEEYSYVGLPVMERADVREIRLVDLAGEGREAVLVRYVERGGVGTREVLAAFRLTGEGMTRTFGCEVAKSLGGRRLETRVTLAKRGEASDIVVEALPALGWDETTYKERPAEDLVSIPLPWGEARRLRFHFKGDDYFRTE